MLLRLFRIHGYSMNLSFIAHSNQIQSGGVEYVFAENVLKVQAYDLYDWIMIQKSQKLIILLPDLYFPHLNFTLHQMTTCLIPPRHLFNLVVGPNLTYLAAIFEVRATD